MPAIALFLSQLKLIHFVVLGAIIFALGMLGYSQLLKTRLETCTNRYERFVAETDAAASQQIALNAQETVKRDTITRNLENDNAKLQSDLASKYAEYRRLLNTSTRSRPMPSVPATPESGACGQESAESATAVYEFERRITDILERGDKAIAEAITLEDWLDQQHTLAHQ